MKTKETIHEERDVTIRQEIIDLLGESKLTVNELSKEIGKSEKELYNHLEHLLRSKSLVIIPAECLKCGYIFEKRAKIKKPGKCPKCKNTYIKQPIFTATRS